MIKEVREKEANNKKGDDEKAVDYVIPMTMKMLLKIFFFS